MSARTTLILALAVVAALVATPAEAGLDWFGLQIGPGGVGLSLGFGSWWVHADSWDAWDGPLDYDVALSGYGEWVFVSGLGRVWQPWVAADWRPYSQGRWVWTHVGWTWVAYEPWGYFPHHYGSWALASAGWVWVPGYTYTPANVMWVSAGSRIGWYACPPHGWSHSSRGFWHGYSHGRQDGYRNGYRDGWRDARYASFVDWNRFGDENVSRHAVVGSAVPRTHGATVLAGAPARDEVVRRGGRPVPEARLTERAMRIGDRTVTVARPEGVAPSVRRHAADTVSRALRPDVARRLESARVQSTRPRQQSGPEVGAAHDRTRSARSAGRSAPAASPRPLATQRTPSRTTPASPSRERAGEASIQPAPAPRRIESRRSQPAAGGGSRQSEARQPTTRRSSPPSRRSSESGPARAPRREVSARTQAGRPPSTANRSSASAKRSTPAKRSTSVNRTTGRSTARRSEATSTRQGRPARKPGRR